jgi:hypothetical protein
LQQKRWQNAAGVLTTMDEEPRRRIIDAVEQALKLAGAKGFEDAEATMQQIADFFAHRVKPIMNRERLEALLQQAELPPEDEQMFIAMAESFPSLIGVALNMLSSEAAKTFPVSNTGRPKSLTSTKRRAVCEHIARLYGQGTNLKVAKKRTAQKFNVSLSTVERSWAERKIGHKPSLNELIDFLKSPKQTVDPG